MTRLACQTDIGISSKHFITYILIGNNTFYYSGDTFLTTIVNDHSEAPLFGTTWLQGYRYERVHGVQSSEVRVR